MSGMGTMRTDLSTVDMVKLITACKKAGVSHLSVHGLKVTFFKEVPKEELAVVRTWGKRGPVVSEKDDGPKQMDLPFAGPKQEMTEDLVQKIQDEIEDKEERIALAMIEDPLQYEELISQKDLVDEQQPG